MDMSANYPYYYAPPPLPPYAPPPPPGGKRRRTRRRVVVGLGAGIVAAGLVASGVAIGDATSGPIAGSGSAQALPSINGGGITGNGGLGNGSTGGSTGNGSGGGTTGNGSGGGTTSASVATPAEAKGVVTVVSVLKYQNAESAGTGMVLTADGEVLTNNHVIDGATSVTVTLAATGKSYRADVVGTDPSSDVAVLQLRNASGLPTANVGDSSDVGSGDSIVGVGNAGGTGTLRASSGKVIALNQSITATDDSGQNAEKLRGLIGVNAAIISGDSGGPMYDSAGKVIGMNTAAAQSPSSSTSAYVIPIDSAVAIADKIETGVRTSTIHIGLPGFIGVGVADANGAGAGITSVLAGGPAASAGITSGSVITAVDGTKVSSAASLRTALASDRPGSSVKITWSGTNGTAHTSNVTLATGPAD
jgi:S1-C subfamily serine protease